MALPHLLVRSVHVLAMAVAVGGAVVVWWLLRANGGRTEAVRIATGYEWLFWAAMGVLVATGVGNLGALAPGVPGPGTQWGVVFNTKLLAVLGLLLLSLGRTVIVVEIRKRVDTGANRFLSQAYAVTTLYLLSLLALAEVLAHG
ncbi:MULTISPECIES: hypothetical protein [unclassified Haladaptatus]|uniref:hypothetical protein n=1 Tax=unclassified Haladaptatus TaxID=2622732 RepID=UPI0023E78ECA|nr:MULTISPECIES: hypothetical protein [unclassified Haladaptatus]